MKKKITMLNCLKESSWSPGPRKLCKLFGEPGAGALGNFFRSPEDLCVGSTIIDLLMGLFRGAVFQHGGVPENCPLAIEWAVSSP